MIYTTLLPHQQQALEHLKSHDPCGLFVPFGYGKSLIALAYADHIKAHRILITSDKNNVINTWPGEIYRHTNFECLVRPTEWDAAEYDVPLCIVVNYEFLYAHKYAYAYPWDCWIGDESGEFKDQRTHKFDGINFVHRTIPHQVILNGRAVTERLEDIYGQLCLIGGRDCLGSTLTRFRQKYMMPEPHGYGWLPQRSALSRIKRDAKEIAYWQAETDKVKMPQRHYHTVTVEMTEEQKKLDYELQTTFASCFKETEIETKYAPVVYQKRIQLCGGIFRGSQDNWETVETDKLAVVRKVIEQNPASKIVVWHTYIPETQILSQLLDEMEHPYSVLDEAAQSQALLSFAKAQPPATLLIRTSLCKGLNQLADADIAVFYSNPLSYARRIQAEGRTRRITSTNPDTHYVDIITKRGADEQVFQLLSQKKSFSLTLANLKNYVENNSCKTSDNM
jgi:hypothetical protein